MIDLVAPTELVEIIEYGIEVGEFVTAADVLQFVEAPYRRYPKLIVAWEHDRDVQGELQDEARARL